MLVYSPAQPSFPSLPSLYARSLEPLDQPCPARSTHFAAKSRVIRTYATHTPNPFTMNTSRTQHLKSLGINTYRKTGEGVARTSVCTLLLVYPERLNPRPKRPNASRFRYPFAPFPASRPLSGRYLTIPSGQTGVRYSLLTTHSLPTTHFPHPFDKAAALV